MRVLSHSNPSFSKSVLAFGEKHSQHRAVHYLSGVHHRSDNPLHQILRLLSRQITMLSPVITFHKRFPLVLWLCGCSPSVSVMSRRLRWRDLREKTPPEGGDRPPIRISTGGRFGGSACRSTAGVLHPATCACGPVFRPDRAIWIVRAEPYCSAGGWGFWNCRARLFASGCLLGCRIPGFLLSDLLKNP